MEQASCPYRALGRAASYCGPLYDDLEVARGWTIDPDGTDTATSGTWQRGDPVVGRPDSSARRSPAVPSSSPGRHAGADVDGGRTTIRSRSIHLPSSKAATLRLRYWVGMSADATAHDRFRVLLVRPSDGHMLATALTATGTGGARRPPGTDLRFAIPSALRGEDVAVQLYAADAGADATVEAGVDDVRITVADP